MKRILFLVCLVILLLGCPQGKEEKGPQPIESIKVTLTEFKISPNNLRVQQAGLIRFEVTNEGRMLHDFEVEGNGIEKKVVVEPAQTKNLDIKLVSGEYKVYCTLPGHEGMGMKASLIVR